MHVKILGSGAGGGFPQWNCACQNCRAQRAGTFSGKPRTQLQVALSADGQSWVLLNASPDIRFQINQTPELYPGGGNRGTPISSVVLTSAELDQILGLLVLREFQPFRVYATRSVLKILREDNSLFAALNRVSDQVSWIEIAAGGIFSIQGSASGSGALHFRPVSVEPHFPTYVSEKRCSELCEHEATLGLIVEDDLNERLAYFPSIPRIDDSLLKQLASAKVILVDGTFWSDDELIQVRGEGPTARQIGHNPMSGEDGSLQQLRGLAAEKKIFVHINNTNPVLNESSDEFRQVREAGWEVAEDGWGLTL